jgi:hypothetical protein
MRLHDRLRLLLSWMRQQASRGARKELTELNEPHHHDADFAWSFPGPLNEAVFACQHVTKSRRPVLYVTHEESDGYWQFLCGKRHIEKDVRMSCRGCIIARDHSLRDLADLPLGWRAVRKRVGAQWSRSRIRADQ